MQNVFYNLQSFDSSQCQLTEIHTTVADTVNTNEPSGVNVLVHYCPLCTAACISMLILFTAAFMLQLAWVTPKEIKLRLDE